MTNSFRGFSPLDRALTFAADPAADRTDSLRVSALNDRTLPEQISTFGAVFYTVANRRDPRAGGNATDARFQRRCGMMTGGAADLRRWSLISHHQEYPRMIRKALCESLERLNSFEAREFSARPARHQTQVASRPRASK
jgi:hypothetical protein